MAAGRTTLWAVEQQTSSPRVYDDCRVVIHGLTTEFCLATHHKLRELLASKLIKCFQVKNGFKLLSCPQALPLFFITTMADHACHLSRTAHISRVCEESLPGSKTGSSKIEATAMSHRGDVCELSDDDQETLYPSQSQTHAEWLWIQKCLKMVLCTSYPKDSVAFAVYTRKGCSSQSVGMERLDADMQA